MKLPAAEPRGIYPERLKLIISFIYVSLIGFYFGKNICFILSAYLSPLLGSSYFLRYSLYFRRNSLPSPFWRVSTYSWAWVSSS